MAIDSLWIGLAATFSGTLALFWKADDGVSPALREALAKYLLSVRVSECPPRFFLVFAQIFDTTFGTRIFSVRFFLVSAASSLISTLIIYVYFIYRHEIELEWITRYIDSKAGASLLLLIFINIITDYVSFAETRLIVSMIDRLNSFKATLGLLFFDLVVTFVLFLLISGGATSLILWASNDSIPFGPADPTPFDWYAKLWWAMFEQGAWRLDLEGGNPYSIGIPLYSTYFTSILLWLSAAAWFMFRAARVSGLVVKFLQWALPVGEKPIRSLGEVTAITAAFAYLLIAMV